MVTVSGCFITKTGPVSLYGGLFVRSRGIIKPVVVLLPWDILSHFFTLSHFSLPNFFSHFLTFTISLVYLRTTDEILMIETNSSILGQLANHNV